MVQKHKLHETKHEHVSKRPSKDEIVIKKSHLMTGIAVVVLVVAAIVFFMSSKGLSSDDGAITPPAKDGLEVIVVNSKDCATCDPSNINSVTTQLFPDAVFRNVDISSKEGRELVSKYSLVYAPSFIFDKKVTESDSWKNNPNIKGYFTAVGDGYRLKDEATGASWFINEQKRAEYEATIAQYPVENLKILGYSSDKPRLDYFVMAFCPFGNPADEAASQVYGLLGDKVMIVPHYIMGVNGNQISSLHGEQEGNQGVRELCVLDEFGMDTFFKFTLKVNELCTATNADTCWKGAASSVGLDTAKVEACESSKKLQIAAEQDALIGKLRTIRQGVLVTPSASPTFLINGVTYEGGRSGEALKQALCAKFSERPAECGEVITATTSAPQGNC